MTRSLGRLLLAGGLLGAVSLLAADWPQWRGPARTGRVPAGTPVPVRLAAPPAGLWRRDIGGGFSSPVVAGGKLVYLDAQDGQETAHAVEAQTGRELWRVAYDAVFEDEWGPGPRSTPLLDGDRLYVQSCRGELRCLHLADGRTLWRANFQKDFGAMFVGRDFREATADRRGNNGCGVVDDARFIAPVGSTNGASLVCFDKHTGRVLWRTGHDPMAQSSLMVATLAGRRQVVAFTADALLGAEAQTGRILWRVPVHTLARRHVATPVLAGDDVLVGSITAGLLCVRVAPAGQDVLARPIWTNLALRVNLSTPVRVGEHLFVQGPMRQFVCAHVRTGRQAWAQPGFGQSYAAAIGLGTNLLVLTDRGELRLLAADPRGYVDLGRTQVCGETWSHPAYADGLLYVREGLTRGWKLSCLRLLP